MILCLIYLFAALAYPISQTYKLLQKDKSGDSSQSMWAVYWAIYCVLHLLKSYLPFLSIRTFEVVIVLFLVWLYHPEFRGALYLKTRLSAALTGNLIANTMIDTIKSLNDTLCIFESQSSK